MSENRSMQIPDKAIEVAAKAVTPAEVVRVLKSAAWSEGYAAALDDLREQCLSDNPYEVKI